MDVLYNEEKLYLVFEYMSKDLKMYMDSLKHGLPLNLAKVSVVFKKFLFFKSGKKTKSILRWRLLNTNNLI